MNAALAVATLNVDLGEGYDTVDDDANNLTLSQDLIFRGVNLFENDGFLSIARHAVVDTLAEMGENIFANNGQMFVAGNFTYVGGDGRDELRLNGASGTTITLATMIDLGDNIFGGTQFALLDNSNVFLGGPLTVLSTSPVNPDVFATDPGGSYNGNIFVNLGDGPNDATITGFFTGSQIDYNGGDGVDTVTFGTTGSPAMFNASLGQGDDVFTLLAGANIASPFIVNFGGNADTFINLYGPFDVDAELLGLNGFNHIYDVTNTTLTSTQVVDLGPVIVDNNGAGGSIRFTTSNTTDLAPVTNLEINMLGGSTSSLELDWDNDFNGNLEVNLNSGPRTLDFTGDSNLINGDLTVTAGSGDQVVALAVNTNLGVTGNALIDLGIGADSITDGGNNLSFLQDLTLDGANTYLNTGSFVVAGNLSVNNGADSDPSTLDQGGIINVGGDFSYLGNIGADFVNLTAANIGGNINVGLGDGVNILNLCGLFGGSSVSFSSGSDADIVKYCMTGSPASIVGNLGNGDDTFELVAGTDVTSLNVDFGNDADTFINGYGPFDFPAVLNGLAGFNHNYDPVGGTLTSVQVSDTGGPVTVDTNGAGNSARVISSSTTMLGPVSHIDVSMLNGSGNDLMIDLDTPLAGNLTVDLGNGIRTLDFTGTSNSVGGALDVSGGSEAQTVNVAVNNDLTVGNDASFALGTGSDTFSVNGNNATIPGNLLLQDVNDFDNDGTVAVGGNLTIDSSGENESTEIIDNAMLDISGDLDYFGGDANDRLILNAGTAIGGDIDVKAAGGDNTAVILGVFGGADIKYNGTDGVDNVTLGTTGNPADINAKLGTGDDTFVLNAGTAIAANSLRVDFGGGDDTFTSNYGVFDFNAQLLNLDGYTAIYDLASGNLDITQVADTGDVTIDNNGGSSAIRFGVGTMNVITPATDLRLILQDNTNTNVTADFDNARIGNTVIQLRSGDRSVFFTGDSNSFTGLLRIEASDGVQDINLAVVADLNVDGTLVVNGRDGSDRIIAENSINVTGAMLLRGVNTFVNNSGLSVGGDLNMITVLENEDTKLISNTTFLVGGNLTYLGGGGVDAINFKSNGASIAGFTYIDIATSTDVATNQRIVLTGGFSTASLVVDGGNAVAGNFFSTDFATSVATDVIVNFASSNAANTAIFQGTFGGTYGTYRGGTGNDFVVVGANASNMLFAALTGDGDDTFTIALTAVLDFLYVDFGSGNDHLDNQLGDPLPFGNNIFNN